MAHMNDNGSSVQTEEEVRTAANSASEQAGAREVIRCGDCNLVQFRTSSDRCRRCDLPLPRPYAEIKAAEEAQKIVMVGNSSTTAFKPTFNALELRGKTIPEFPLGARLRELREFRNLTQLQLAQLARVPRTYVSRIEHAHLLPGLGVVQRIANALNVDVLDLVPDLTNPNGNAFPGDDSFWSLFSRYFRGLSEEQKAEVIAKARTMIVPKATEQPRAAEPARAAEGLPIFRSVPM